MNRERLAKLFRERAALDLEIAEALLEEETKQPRKRPRTPLSEQRPSQASIDRVRSSLERQGLIFR